MSSEGGGTVHDEGDDTGDAYALIHLAFNLHLQRTSSADSFSKPSPTVKLIKQRRDQLQTWFAPNGFA